MREGGEQNSNISLAIWWLYSYCRRRCHCHRCRLYESQSIESNCDSFDGFEIRMTIDGKLHTSYWFYAINHKTANEQRMIRNAMIGWLFSSSFSLLIFISIILLGLVMPAIYEKTAHVEPQRLQIHAHTHTQRTHKLCAHVRAFLLCVCCWCDRSCVKWTRQKARQSVDEHIYIDC